MTDDPLALAAQAEALVPQLQTHQKQYGQPYIGYAPLETREVLQACAVTLRAQAEWIAALMDCGDDLAYFGEQYSNFRQFQRPFDTAIDEWKTLRATHQPQPTPDGEER